MVLPSARFDWRPRLAVGRVLSRAPRLAPSLALAPETPPPIA